MDELLDEENMQEMKKQILANIPQMVEEKYESMFEKYDTNKNGVIDRDEAKEMFKDLCFDEVSQGFQFTEENFASKFNEWGINGSGTISKDEFKILL